MTVPIGRTPRSNPATYTHVTPILSYRLDAEAKIVAIGQELSSLKGGAASLPGRWHLRIEMQFLPDVMSLRVAMAGATSELGYGDQVQRREHPDVLDMTVDEAPALLSRT